MRRTIGMIAAFTLAGPPIGVLVALVGSLAHGLVTGGLEQDLPQGLAIFPFAVIFAYVAVGPVALVTGIGSAIALRSLSSRPLRFVMATAIGFACSFAYMAFRTDGLFQSGRWPADGSWSFAITGAIAAAGSLAVYDYFEWLEAERQK